MNNDSLIKYILGIADNSLILGQRLGELTGHGPTLEVDIAMTNISLDLFGQVRSYFQYAAQLSEEDKMAVGRARRVQRFLSQPFHVAEQFTGIPGVLVDIKETIKGFNMIMDGELDHLPEAAFNLKGTIEEAIAAGEKMLAEA